MPFKTVARAAGGVFIVGLSLVGPAGSAQTLAGRETTAQSVVQYSLSQQMPVDPEVLVGGLENGLRFYVRPNGRPARQAELRLVVRAGSVLEEEHQRGLAHFVEHMQFEGTRNFPGQGINDFLASLGLSIGADANAATSFDDTQYTLRVPTNVPGALDRALQVLADWAQGATFDEAAIERQRGIIRSEWRMRLGADERTQDKIRRAQLAGSRYVDRSPIGVPEAIERFTRADLVRFYQDWYRPDLMAVIVVGDVDQNSVAALIRRHFAGLVNPSPERPRPAYDVPEHPSTRFAVVTDAENTATAVLVTNLRPARNQGTVGGYRDILLDQLFAGMLDERLTELEHSADPPFLSGQAARGLFPAPKTRDQALLQAIVANDGVEKGLDALVTELERVIRFGFTPSELDRAKRADIAAYERVVAESPDRESESRADEYTRNFLQDEALPTIWQELAFHRRFVPAITLEQVNARAADWFPEQNRLVIVAAPEGAATIPDETRLSAVMRAAAAKTLDPYADADVAVALMAAAPKPGRIVKTVNRPSGITEWTLSNGATVVLQPTTLKVDQILFRAVAPGGTSLATDLDFIPARVADDVIAAGGVGDLDAVALDRLLTGRAVAVRPFMSEISHGLLGGGSPRDLETLFQLIHLRITRPRADERAFSAMRAQALALLPNQAASPDFAFSEAVSAALSGNHPRRPPETPETVARWNLEKSLAFYKARFADAAGFRFFFVGSFAPQEMRPLVETYLASLPATHAGESWRDVGVVAPRGVIERTVRKGLAPRAEVSIIFSGPFQYDDANALALRTVSMLLQSRLSEAIREELGATYSITVDTQSSKYPRPEYRVRIDWTCDPARVDSLVQRVFQEVEVVKRTLLSPDRVARVRDILAKEFEEQSRENGYLLTQLVGRYENGEPDAAGVSPMGAIAELSGYSIQLAAQSYLDTKNYVKVVLLPEGR